MIELFLLALLGLWFVGSWLRKDRYWDEYDRGLAAMPDVDEDEDLEYWRNH